MTLPPKMRSVGSLLFTLALLAAILVPSGLVLCIGRDGHVAIESAIESEPCGVPLRESTDLGAPPIEDCRDTALSQAPLRVVSDSEAAPVPFVAVASWTSPDPFVSRAISHPRAAAIPDFDLRAHRTVVLLV